MVSGQQSAAADAVTMVITCSTCQFRPTGGLKGHTAKKCVLKEFVCKRSLPTDHPLRTPGECLIETCIHNAVCTVCNVKGHRVMTLTYSPSRWMWSPERTLVRARRQTPLKLDDFACALLTQQALDAFMESVQSEAGAASQARQTAADTVSRIQANLFQANLPVRAAADLMASSGSRAASVHPDNAANYAALLANADRGAVAADFSGAEAAEGPMEGPRLPRDLSTSDEDEEDFSSAATGGSVPRTPRAVRAHRDAVEGMSSVRAGRVSKETRRMWDEAAAQRSAMSGAAAPVGGDERGGGGGGGWVGDIPSDFSRRLPSLRMPAIARLPPSEVARLVLEGVSCVPLAEVEVGLRRDIERGAQHAMVRGLMLVSSGCTPAFIAERLCSRMDGPQRTSMLPVVAQWVFSYVNELKERDA